MEGHAGLATISAFSPFTIFEAFATQPASAVVAELVDAQR
jgi:hypothetical protein